MEKKTIWHSGILPEPNRTYLHFDPDRKLHGGYYIGTRKKETNVASHIARKGKFCYLDELVATSKALDVAIDALNEIDYFNCTGKGSMDIIGGMTTIAHKAKYKIENLMKGGK